MTREEQIEEFANYYCEYCKSQTGEKFCEHIDDKSCNIFFEAELFYNAGYRKAEEVRKETAKEILQCLYDKCYEISNMGKGGISHVLPIDILQFAEKYGVEVEE